MKALFVINPSSGRRQDLDRLRLAIDRRCAIARIESHSHQCSDKDELDGLIANARADGFDTFIAVGGDGTVHELGIRLISTGLVLGILPAGSGNGLARHLGISIDPEAALEAIAGSHVETIDTATVDGRPYLGVAGVGFDAAVAHRFGLGGERGFRTYVRESALLLRSFEPARYSIDLGDEKIETRALLVAVANSNQYGNEARIAPKASLRDGLLDVCVLEHPPLVTVPLLLTRLFVGALRDGPGVTIRRVPTAVVEREVEGEGHLDGEPVFLGRRMEFSIRPASLRVLVPRSDRRI